VGALRQADLSRDDARALREGGIMIDSALLEGIRFRLEEGIGYGNANGSVRWLLECVRALTAELASAMAALKDCGATVDTLGASRKMWIEIARNRLDERDAALKRLKIMTELRDGVGQNYRDARAEADALRAEYELAQRTYHWGRAHDKKIGFRQCRAGFCDRMNSVLNRLAVGATAPQPCGCPGEWVHFGQLEARHQWNCPELSKPAAAPAPKPIGMWKICAGCGTRMDYGFWANHLIVCPTKEQPPASVMEENKPAPETAKCADCCGDPNCEDHECQSHRAKRHGATVKAEEKTRGVSRESGEPDRPVPSSERPPAKSSAAASAPCQSRAPAGIQCEERGEHDEHSAVVRYKWTFGVEPLSAPRPGEGA
jgi:hypothetical protein